MTRLLSMRAYRPAQVALLFTLPLAVVPQAKATTIFLLTGTASVDPEFYLLDIGNGSSAFLGQACQSCIRTSLGAGPDLLTPNGARVGSIISNFIATSLASLATTDAQRLNQHARRSTYPGSRLRLL